MLMPGAEAGRVVDPVGIALAATAGTCYGAYTVCVKRVLATAGDRMIATTVSLGLGTVLLAPMLLRDGSAFLNARGLFVIAWVGVVATAVAYLLYVRGLARVPAATAGTLSLAEPLTAMVLGIAVLGERPSVVALMGALLVIGGLIVAAFPRHWLSGAVRSEPTSHVANA